MEQNLPETLEFEKEIFQKDDMERGVNDRVDTTVTVSPTYVGGGVRWTF